MKLADSDFDRAHRVGRPTDREGNNVKDRQMIVKFTSFRARTLVYRHRAKGKGDNKENDRVRFYLDQTKRRFQLRKWAIEYAEKSDLVDFVFVDINCSLSIRFKNGEFKQFNSKEELKKLVVVG